MRHLTVFAILVAALLAVVACKGEEKTEETAQKAVNVDFPGSVDGAMELLKTFLASDANPVAITAALRPTDEDYKAVFAKDVDAIKASYDAQWEAGGLTITHDPDQTEIRVWASTSEGFTKMLDGPSFHFPGGYMNAEPWFQRGVTFYRFKFVPPGEELGMGWDGLVHINGHWAFFPKPWRALPGWAPGEEMDMLFDNMSPHDIRKMMDEAKADSAP